MARWRALPALPLLLALLFAGCGSGTDAEGVRVVATTTILGDVVRNVVGDGATVEVLIPLGADPHDYQASSQQVAAIRKADLVVANGLGLEEGLSDILESLAADGANVIEIAPLVDPIPFGDEAAADPHVWFDPIRMADAAGLIATEMASVDPKTDWAARADAYGAELQAADEDITSILGAIPESGRVLVTNHDALEYFAARYDFEVAGTVIPAGTTLAEPSSAALAALVAEIERLGVRAVFAETTEPLALAEAIAAEVGDGISVVELYTGSLGEPGSGADTLIGMLLTDARRIAGALG
jgi:zinc/manganese transport system substrate-binding protein